MADDDPASPTGSNGLQEMPTSVSVLIERWWQDHFPGSAVARHAEAWNVAHAAKEALRNLCKSGLASRVMCSWGDPGTKGWG